MPETRTKRPSRWLCAIARGDGQSDLYALKEVQARTALKAAEEYRAGENEAFKGVVVVYPLRPVGEPAFFSQTMMPVMVPCEQPAGKEESG